MNRLAVLVVRDSSPIRFAGLDLADRAARVARRAGAETVQLVDDDQPFASAPPAELLLVLPERVVVEPGLLADLMRRSPAGLEDAAIVVDAEGESTDILLLSPEAVKRIRFAPRVRSGLRQLAVEAVVTVVNPGSRFCARLRDARDVARVEAEYLHATNGGNGEGLFTKNIRWFSIPLTTQLVRLGVTANAVTIAGFALAVAAGAAFAVGHYWTGIGGALLYFASMVLDCSDGEVARVTVSDSKFGAWLETVTDYLSYFVVLGGIVCGDVRWEGFCKHATSAIVAAAATAAIVLLVGYLRARVASDNPGAFDDALATQLQDGNLMQRFAVCGRQLIKRSFVAHLILFQALIGEMPALTEIWALGSAAALLIVIAVHTHIIRTVKISPLQPAVTV